MDKIVPNYTDFGFADQMGKQLKKLVECQLTEDLKFYQIDKNDLRFDWSDSCVEGHATTLLDGSVENFSGIAVFDDQDNFLAEGWMEFIHEKNFFLAYWEFLDTWNNEKMLRKKNVVGIPDHIWRQIPDDILSIYEKDKMQLPSRLP